VTKIPVFFVLGLLFGLVMAPLKTGALAKLAIGSTPVLGQSALKLDISSFI